MWTEGRQQGMRMYFNIRNSIYIIENLNTLQRKMTRLAAELEEVRIHLQRTTAGNSYIVLLGDQIKMLRENEKKLRQLILTLERIRENYIRCEKRITADIEVEIAYPKVYVRRVSPGLLAGEALKL